MVLPGAFCIFTALMLILGKVMEDLDANRPKRLYNKLSFKTNLQKYSFSRLLGSMILQFNPFFNYIVKPNHYIGRPMRLLIINCYFQLISMVSLMYFCSKPDELLLHDVLEISLFI